MVYKHTIYDSLHPNNEIISGNIAFDVVDDIDDDDFYINKVHQNADDEA